MRFKFTIFLLGLNLIIFGLIFYLTNKSASFDDSSSNLSGLIGKNLAEAEKIELQSSALTQPWVLSRKGSDWNITEPLEWKANYFAVNRILNQLQFIEEKASFTINEITNTGQNLADYGLEDPLVELIISEGGDEMILSIGAPTEIGNNIYLLGPDRERIYVVGREFMDNLPVGLDELRNRDIFDIPVFEVSELSVQIKSEAGRSDNDNLKVRLSNTTGQWRFEAPLSAEADPALVSNTINTLASLKVGRFIESGAGDPVIQGLENPSMRITLHGNKRRQTLLVGSPDPSAQAQRSAQLFARLEGNPITFTVDARPFENLIQAQESLRERHFMTFDEANLKGIYITEGSREIRLQEIKTDDWQVLESSGNREIQPNKADLEVMTALFQDLRQLRAKAFVVDAPSNVDLERLGFNTPRRVVSLRFDNGDPLVLQLAHPEDENVKLYARTLLKPSIYEVERRPTLQNLPLNSLHYRNRNIETLPQAARIRSFTLTNLLNDEIVFNYEVAEGKTWINLLDEMGTAEADAVSTLLSSLRSFSVKTYLRDTYSEAYILGPEKSLPWTYRLEAEIILPGGEVEQTKELEYFFTERLSGTTQVGTSKAQNAVFELKLDLIEALYVLNDNMVLPPESLGQPIPEPVPPEPVPEPKASDTETE
jgi:hypothetical protein